MSNHPLWCCSMALCSWNMEYEIFQDSNWDRTICPPHTPVMWPDVGLILLYIICLFIHFALFRATLWADTHWRAGHLWYCNWVAEILKSHRLFCVPGNSRMNTVNQLDTGKTKGNIQYIWENTSWHVSVLKPRCGTVIHFYLGFGGKFSVKAPEKNFRYAALL